MEYYSSYSLYHHGIKGQKWGERRFQEEDGSLTPAGRERYLKEGRGPAAKSYGANTLAKEYKHNPVKMERASTYWERDPDWDDKNYSEKTRVSGTDFHMFTKPDGSIVILEEDMKWTVPAGSATESEMSAALKKFNKDVKQKRENGDWTSTTWEKMVNEYMTQAVRNSKMNKDKNKKKVPRPDIAKKAVAQAMQHSDLAGYELYHHGILGMKWGQRRFQNADGTYTEEGKRRRREENYGERVKEKASKFYANNKNAIAKIGKTALLAAGVGVSAYLIAKNKDAVISALSDSVKRVGKTMLDASLASVGMITIDKLSKQLPTDESIDERTRNMNRIIFDTASAGIKEATKASGSSNNSKSSNNASVGKEITDRLGPPSNKGIDRQSVEYQSLFKDSSGNQRDSTTRSVIKSLASNGYDINQIREYIKGVDNGTIKHSLQEIGYYAVLSLSREEL